MITCFLSFEIPEISSRDKSNDSIITCAFGSVLPTDSRISLRGIRITSLTFSATWLTASLTYCGALARNFVGDVISFSASLCDWNSTQSYFHYIPPFLNGDRLYIQPNTITVFRLLPLSVLPYSTQLLI